MRKAYGHTPNVTEGSGDLTGKMRKVYGHTQNTMEGSGDLTETNEKGIWTYVECHRG